MNVVVDVGGREAIPVRAIPFATGWWMSPDKVATVLAQTDQFTKMRAVGSYQLDQSGTPRKALPKDWDQYVACMDALTARLKAAQSDEAISYADWQRLSIELLPAGVFVWKDEFEVAFNKAYSEERLTILHEREGDRELNFFPIDPPEGQAKVMEGFDGIALPNSGHGEKATLPNPEVAQARELGTKERNSLLLIIAAACEYAKLDVTTHAKTAGVLKDKAALMGVQIGETTIENHLKKIPDVLAARKP